MNPKYIFGKIEDRSTTLLPGQRVVVHQSHPHVGDLSRILAGETTDQVASDEIVEDGISQELLALVRVRHLVGAEGAMG